MDLSTLDREHRGHYAPAFRLKVGDNDVVRQLFLAVSSVEVELTEKKASRFTFHVGDAFDWESRSFVSRAEKRSIDLLELFPFGTPVEIAFGYGDVGNLVPLLTGLVTEISTNFGESGAPELIVSGYDNLYPLVLGRQTFHWENARDSDAVRDLLRNTGLDADIRATEPVRPRIDQSQETDMALLEKIAERNKAIFYARGNRAYFGPRNNDKAAKIELALGKGLLSFSPELNLAQQVSSVEVSGWSTLTGKPIVGRAASNVVSGRDTRRQTGADQVASALKRKPVMRIRSSVHTQAEADAQAKALLEECAQHFLQGECESVGLPQIVPDINIALLDLGSPFSQPYYVKSATHRINSDGYRTSFSVEEPRS